MAVVISQAEGNDLSMDRIRAEKPTLLTLLLALVGAQILPAGGSGESLACLHRQPSTAKKGQIDVYKGPHVWVRHTCSAKEVALRLMATDKTQGNVRVGASSWSLVTKQSLSVRQVQISQYGQEPVNIITFWRHVSKWNINYIFGILTSKAIDCYINGSVLRGGGVWEFWGGAPKFGGDTYTKY